ncbi:MAG: trypsin-like peptidase domain-containing protein [Acidobacteria bacterium]|nr:trypsin-like peptidase domain-containing protein [Acidobacteriota bacterium]
MPVNGFGEIAESLRRSTVLVHAGGRGNGSGVIWSSDGVIVTNAHVAQRKQLRVQLWDSRELDATVIATDPARDIASMRLRASNLPAASIGNSSRLRPGELAIAIGNPLGFVGALTTGVIHAVGSVPGLGSQRWVQAGVRLAPGNSGGPLADAAGRVIGINTMVAWQLALAIPTDAVGEFLAGGTSRQRPYENWLGVTLYPVQVPRNGNHAAKTFGLVVLNVEPESPAARASLLPGDILLGAEDKPFSVLDDLSRALRGEGPRTLRLEFLRGDYARVRRVTVQLGSSTVGSRVAA